MLGDKLNELISSKQDFDENTEAGHLNKVSLSLAALDDLLREQIQSVTSNQIQEIIRKLRSDAEINDADLALVKLWLIGDAQAYLEMENDYKGWLSELNRLFSVIEEMKSADSGIEGMVRLSGVVRDAIRVTGDIVFFKQQQERVQKFEDAIKGLHSGSKSTLANILEAKLDSYEM